MQWIAKAGNFSWQSEYPKREQLQLTTTTKEEAT
jgi:hypothetical protein